MLVGVRWMFFFPSTTLRNTEFLQSIKNILIKNIQKYQDGMRKQKTVSFLSGTSLNNSDNGQERPESSFCSHHNAGFEVQHGFT